ncbi:MAG: hypothetical protein QME92_04165 [Bacillota bacterium]|nr:hypothetical protein [Bacillota bacterium]
MWLDGKCGPEYDQIGHIVKGVYVSTDIVFSPDGERLAYAARKGTKWIVVVDGKEGPAYDEIGAGRFSSQTGSLAFSSDGMHFAYVAIKGKNNHLVLDGKEGPPYQGIEQVTFSPDARKVAFVSWKGKTRDGLQHGTAFKRSADCKYVMVRGDREYEGALCPAFSADGSHLAHIVRKSDSNGGSGQRVVLDGMESSEYDEIVGCYPLRFGQEGTLEFLAVRKSFADERMDTVIDRS